MWCQSLRRTAVGYLEEHEKRESHRENRRKSDDDGRDDYLRRSLKLHVCGAHPSQGQC